nr:MAG TPA: capsid [Picobirnaviridae sp.]
MSEKDKDIKLPDGNNQTPATDAGKKEDPKGKEKGKGKETPNKNGKNKKGVRGKQNHRDNPRRNDWRFYAASEEIAKSVASVPFNYMGGTPFNIKGTVFASDEAPAVAVSNTAAIPAVMALDYVPSIGNVAPGTATSINLASAQLYTMIRRANSGAKVYEAADVMMYVLAMQDIYASYFNCKRALGCLKLHTIQNHNLPKAVLRALQIDYEDLRANAAQYRAILNELATKINAFAIPSYFKAFDRSAFINSRLFGDSNDIKGQIYLYHKTGYYVWSATASETGSSLVWNQYVLDDTGTSKTLSLGEYLKLLNDQIDALYLDSDILTMSGDIFKAFPGKLYAVSEIGEDFITEILYDTDVLAQIENSFALIPNYSLIGRNNWSWNMNVVQSNQLISFNPFVSTQTETAIFTLGLTLNSRAFNSHKENPDFRDVLEWTRNSTVVAIESSATSVRSRAIQSGLEIILGYNIWYYNSQTLTVFSFGHIIPSLSNNIGTQQIALLSNFDWMPILYAPGTVANSPCYIYGDVKNITLLDSEVLSRIHTAAMYGAYFSTEYNAPKVSNRS